MATEMLQKEGAGKAHMLPNLPAAMPGRIFNRGHEHFRKQAENGQPKRLSAVERLEADKAKYVKSQAVINAKQEPIKAVPPSGLASAPLHGSVQDGGGMSQMKKANLNLEILCNLLNCPEGCAAGQGLWARSWAPQSSRSSELHRRSFAESLRVFPTHITNLNLSTSLLQDQPYEGLVHLSFSSSDVRLPLCAKSDPSQPPHPSSHKPSDGPVPDPAVGPWRLSLTRSKSDLSECYARTGANVERFFNYCGLDPDEPDSLVVVESLTRVGSDIISLNLCSASMLSSECGRSLCSNKNLTDDQDSDDRIPYGISAVERNARIIKWLYSIKQARESQRVSHV